MLWGGGGGVGMGRLGVLGGHQGSGLSEGSGPICHVLICSWDWMSALSSPMATSRTVGLLQSLSGGEKNLNIPNRSVKRPIR